MKQVSIFIAFIVLLCYTEEVSAQVTIGSDEKPIKSVVLDIKSHAPDGQNVTSSKGGIIIPRIKLKNISTLEPIITNSDPDIINLKYLHIGLVVYNLTDNQDLKEGLYSWNGQKWEMVVVNMPARENIIAGSGLSVSQNGTYKLGGALNANTGILQNNNLMQFKTGTSTFSVNDHDFIVQNGNIGIGKIPVDNKLDVNGNMQINSNLTVKGETSLKNTEIVNSPFKYKPGEQVNIAGKYLRAIDSDGRALWQNLGGLSSPDMEAFPVDKLVFNPLLASETDYLNTGISIELTPGKWLINYSVRVVAPAITTANTSSIRPSTYRFTMLHEGTPLPLSGKKPYDDSRAYPDVYYNSCSGFMIVENNTNTPLTYHLGIRPEDVSTWPNGNVEIAHNTTKDAYVIAYFMKDSY